MSAPARPASWRQRLRWPVLALLGLNLVVAAVYTLPRGLKQRGLTQRVEALRREAEAGRRVVGELEARQALVRENEAAERRFFAELVSPRQQALVPALVELEGLVAEPGLKASGRNFAAEPSKELPLVRLNVSVSLTGGYRQLVTFLRGLETSKHFLTVDKVSLRERGSARDEGEGALNVGVSAWFRADAEEAARAR